MTEPREREHALEQSESSMGINPTVTLEGV